MQPDVNPMSSKSEAVYSRTSPLVNRPEHSENNLTRLVEQQTAKVPSSYFLFASLLAMASSMVLELSGRTRAATFVGKWPGPLLTMGVYNKLVKML